jgi:hypothetical protein
MFHLLRLNSGICYFVGLICLAISQDHENCEDRHRNIWLSAFQQFFFSATAAFICSESIATFKAITSGIVGGKTWSYVFLSYGVPFFNVGVTMFLYGKDYGKDPRCFIGWENDTKYVFFYQMLLVAAVS